MSRIILTKGQKDALSFYSRSGGWHSFQAKDLETKRIITHLKDYGLLEINAFTQAKITAEGRNALACGSYSPDPN